MTEQQRCLSCLKLTDKTYTAVVNGTYYTAVCRNCLGSDEVSSGVASFERRRDYEDMAQDTIQPYDANGPNPEFYRLYPNQARKVFDDDVIEELKRKI